VKVAELAGRLAIPGVAVGVLDHGQRTLAFYGITSVAAPLEVDEQTLFQIGSTSKTFTATGLMCLVEDGRVDLEAPVRTYLPELRLKDESAAASVRVLHLLNHTAGWSGDLFDDTGDGADALARYVRSMHRLDQQFPPGSGPAVYNNAAVGLAGRIIEKLVRLPFARALEQLVLEPVGLEDTLFSPNRIMTRKFAVGHIDRDGRPEVVRNWRPFRAADPMGGLSSTIHDQLDWAAFHMGDGRGRDGRQVLRPETIELMRRPTARLPVALGDEVGISWLMREVNGVRLVGHGGSTEGQQSAFQMAPERDFALAINTNSILGGQLNRELTAWILLEWLGIEEPELQPVVLRPDQLAEYAGRFQTEALSIAVSVVGSDLHFEQRPSTATRRRLRREQAPTPPDSPPMTARLLEGDVFIFIDGPAKGSKGQFVRQDGAVVAINWGGRLGARAING
jgi:CubicO group peptidase (beta-lactamase class C family)